MQKIISTLNAFGLSTDNLIPDGNIHRCHSSVKNKTNKDGWYGIKEFNGQYYCNYGCWVRGEQGKCSTLNGSGVVNHDIWKQLEEQRKIEAVIREKEGQKKSEKYISECVELEDHPYLTKKQIQSCGALNNGNFIVIPLYNPAGGISSYQTIDCDGRKQFMSGGIVGGCCFPIQGDDSVICICEGFATGASIHAATGYKVLIAFNAGNIIKIARTAVEQFMSSEIIICADNDWKKEKNVGLETGKKVALEFGLKCVWPTGINGSDFNDMAVENGIDSVRQEISQKETIEVMTANDFIGDDDTLKIPDEAIPEGLISQGIEALEGDILQFSLPLVLTVISRAIAGKISVNGVYPNVFNLKIGGTSTGKTATDKRFLQCLNIDKFVSLNDIASGPGLLRGISENPQGMGFFDEVTSLFRRNTKGGVDMVAEGKSDALLDIFSRSGENFIKTYGDSRNSIVINNPCFSLIGNATPIIFDAIQLKDFDSGLMQRFDFWCYDGKILPKKLYNNSFFMKTSQFVSDLNKLMQITLPQTDLSVLIKSCISLDLTNTSRTYVLEYSDYTREMANNEDSAGLIGFISRRFDLMLKYALIHHAATCKNIFSDINDKDIQYGILIAEMLGGWKSNILSSKVVSGDFHRDCEIFKDAIKMAIQQGKNPTFKVMAGRKIKLKNWEEKYSQSIINVLKKRGEILTKETNGVTKYYLPKMCVESEK